MNPDNLITKTSLIKDRGWTDRLIKLFYPEPEKTLPNPRYKKASPMSLYSRIKVNEIEQSAEFLAEFEKVKKRRLVAKKVVAKKRKETIDMAEEISFIFPKISLADARKRGLQQKRDHLMQRCEFLENYTDDDVNRWAWNHIRHNLTGYDSTYSIARGKVGRWEFDARMVRIFAEQATEHFPELKDTIANWLDRKTGSDSVADYF